jgi:hypothetical protein
MKFSVTGQEKGDLSVQVTTWEGLTVLWPISTIPFGHIILIWSNEF